MGDGNPGIQTPQTEFQCSPPIERIALLPRAFKLIFGRIGLQGTKPRGNSINAQDRGAIQIETKLKAAKRG
jgi:hypothetical protein